MDVVILTGMSGAGKSFSANCLEDMGYFCVDNLPPAMIPEMVLAFQKGTHRGTDMDKLAMVVDIRSADMFPELIPSLERVEDAGVSSFTVIFLEADNTELITRYKQTRRNHPLAGGQSLEDAINEERGLLQPLKSYATDVIDTSSLSPSELRARLHQLLEPGRDNSSMTIHIQSFGFKYGVPPDSDIVADVRFIPNPFYRRDLRALTGLDTEVRQYLYAFEETGVYLDLQERLLTFTIPYYVREGKQRLVISVGCTGGRHRSVALAHDLAARIRPLGMPVLLTHRDIDRDPREDREDRAYEDSDSEGPLQ